MSNNYVSLHTHTEQSLLDSCTNYKLYVDKCVELGQKAIAFTEHGNTYNWVEKKMYCDKNNVKFIFGVEVYLTKTHLEKERDNYHTVLIAKNKKGIQEINRLIYTSTHKDHMYYKPRISFDEFLGISDNVIKISACLASPLNAYRKELHYDVRLFSHYDYYEIQPHDTEEQIEYNKWLVEQSIKYNKPLVATGDFHSSSDYKAKCRRIFQFGGESEYNQDDDFDLTYKSYSDFVRAFKKQNSVSEDIYLEAIENTNKIADMVEDFELDTSFKYPILYGDKDEETLWNTLRKKYMYKVNNGIIDKKDEKQYVDNIKEEMRVFKKVGMTGFMLFMSEMISWCWENNIPVGYCRGSVGGSTVSYISDIIDVNPVVWHTVFSRFCNEDRVEVGDIDIDISPDQRHLVYDYIINRFGVENTSYILASGTVSDKGTIDIIGKALRIRWNLKHGLKKNEYHPDNPYNLSIIQKIKDEYAINPEKVKEEYKELFEYFDGILNTVRSQSMHPAGIIASPVNLVDEYGCFKDKDGKNILCINMEECHEVSLIKYDILGLQNIQIIRDTCRYANIPYPKSHLMNWNDEDVWNHICDSPVGIFQFESKYASECLKKMNPHKINDMSLTNAALRPSGESYRERLFAGETNKNPSKQIDELLKENNGFLCIEENQLISTSKGLVPIKDIKVGDMVYTTNGLEKVNKVFNNGVKDVYKLNTKYGEVVCTKDHKILTENGWKEYKDIKIGECIAHYVGTSSTKSYNVNKLKIIGWMLGDGITSGNNIGFINLNKKVVDSYKHCIEDIWDDLTVSIRDVKTRVSKKPLYRCNVKWKNVCHNYDKPIHKYFDTINLRGKKARDKEVPEFIFSLNRESLLCFLGAYTDTDSCLRNNTIMYKTASKKLCKGLVEVLRLIGYSSTVAHDTKTDAYNICVFGGNELVLELKPYSIKIQDNLSNSTIKRKHRLGRVSIELVKNMLSKHNITFKKVSVKTGCSLYYKKYINVETLIKICNAFNLQIPLEVSDNIHYYPVNDKTKIGNANVYDLEINNTHNFVTGGIVTHNCFQEDTIKFLTDICGLSGSEADNVRRAIGRFLPFITEM